MKGKVKIVGIGVVFVVVAVSLAFVSGVFGSHVSPVVCGDTITQSIVLTDADQANLQNCPNEGLIVGASGTSSDPITIDGSGCTTGRCVIDGDNDATGFGINLNGYDNVIIKNLEIKEFNYGIRGTYSENIKIINNHIHHNTNDGISLAFGNNPYIFDNTIEFNTDDGISGGSNSANLIKYNIIRDNFGDGINLFTVDSSYILSNDVVGNDVTGIRLGASNGNFIYYNYIRANGGLSTINDDVNDDGANNWDNGYPRGGNTWRASGSSAKCTDTAMGVNQVDTSNGGDGICDNTNDVPAGIQDRYPLVEISFITETTTLSPSFNLISVELMSAEGKLPDFLNSIEGKYDVLFYYNSSKTPAKWQNYNVNKPPTLNTLKEIKENIGFWIHITDPAGATLSIDGTHPTNSRYDLKLGYNQISYPNNIQILASDAFANVDGSYNSVWTYDIGDPANPNDDEWKFYDGPAGATDTLTQMNPGFGYWVEVVAPVTWDFLNNGAGKYYLA